MESGQRSIKRGLTEWAALGGVGYVALFIIGLFLMFNGAPEGDDPPADFTSWFGDSGHRDRMLFGWILLGLGLLFFLLFVASLRETVKRFDNGVLVTLTGLGGGIYAALAMAAVALEAGVRTMSDDTYQHQVYPELIHAADDASYVMHATGAGALGVMILAASIAFIRSGVVPKWAGWLGVAVGVISLATIAFLPAIVWLLWILVVAIVLFWKGGAHATPERAHAA